MANRRYQINDWILIVEENRLAKGRKSVTLEPRLVNLLGFLAAHPQQVFSRDALIEQVWSGAFVTEQVVTQSIFELRKILKDGDSEAPAFISTVPKRGYRLVASVMLLPNSAMPQSRPPAEEALNVPLFAAPASQVLAPREKRETLTPKWKGWGHFVLIAFVLLAFVWQISPSPRPVSLAQTVLPNVISISVPQNADLSLQGIAVSLQQRLSHLPHQTVRLRLMPSDLPLQGAWQIRLSQSGRVPSVSLVDALHHQVVWQGAVTPVFFQTLNKHFEGTFSPTSMAGDNWIALGALLRFTPEAIEQGLASLPPLDLGTSEQNALRFWLRSAEMTLLHHGLLTASWHQAAQAVEQNDASDWGKLAQGLKSVYQNTPNRVALQGNSPWAWIVSGKQAELRGDLTQAQWDYAQAYYLLPTESTCRWIRSLAFYSVFSPDDKY